MDLANLQENASPPVIQADPQGNEDFTPNIINEDPPGD